MTIKLKPTLDNYKTFMRRYNKKNIFIFKDFTLLIGVICAIFLGLDKRIFNVLTTNANYKFPGTLIGDNRLICIVYDSILIIGLIYLMRFFILKNSIRKLSLFTSLFHEIELTLGDNRLICKRPNSLTEYDYSIIYDCEIVKEYCYLYITPDSALIIPKTTSGFNEFIEKLKEKINVR